MLPLEAGPDYLEFDRLPDDLKWGNNFLRSAAALDSWLLKNVATQFHSSGACKMGPASDPTAVVDQFCHVYGLKA